MCSAEERAPDHKTQQKPLQDGILVKTLDGPQQVYRADRVFLCPYPGCKYSNTNSPTIQVCAFDGISVDYALTAKNTRNT
jgi:hypothetical protein